MTATFEADLDPDSPILRIAEHLYREMQAFGQMATTRYQLRGDTEGYILGRAKPAFRLLSVLEAATDLRFAEPVPHSYALGNWPPELPIAGRACGDEGPLPSLTIGAMVDHWEAASTDKTTYLRLLRSALYLVDKAGLVAAVTYLLDLHAAGAAPQEETVGRVIAELALARARVGSDAELAPFLLQGPVPADEFAWQQTLPSQPDTNVEYRIDALPAPSRAALSAALERAVGDVTAVRRSCDYDSWFTGRLRVGGLIDIVLDELFRQTAYGDKPRPIALEAMLAELEEISVDIRARRGNALLHQLPPSCREDLAAVRDGLLEAAKPWVVDVDHLQLAERLLPPRYAEEIGWAARQVGKGYREAYGEQWAEQMVRTRLLVPTTLGPSVLLDPGPDLGAEWQGLSWRLAHPYSRLFQPSQHPAAIRTEPFEAGEILAHNADLHDFLAGAGLDQQGRQTFVRAALDLLLAGYEPGMHFKDHPDFDEHVMRANETFRQLAEDVGGIETLLSAVQTAHRNTCCDEILSMLEEVGLYAAAGELDRVLDRSEQALALYPWNDELRDARAFAYAGLEDWPSAAEEMVVALGLDPTESNYWTRLESICKALGRESDARLAEILPAVVS